MVKLVSPLQPWNASDGIAPTVMVMVFKLPLGITGIIDEGNVASMILSQPLNTDSPTVVTLLFIVTLANALQPLNAELPIVVTPLPMVTLISPLQPLNAPLPIVITLSGIVTLVNLNYGKWVLLLFVFGVIQQFVVNVDFTGLRFVFGYAPDGYVLYKFHCRCAV